VSWPPSWAAERGADFAEVTAVSHRSTFSAGLREVAGACAGEVEARWADVTVRGVSTDTRDLAPGELFIALVGQQHDGHDFLPAARQAGAAAAVISRRCTPPQGLPVVIVEDTLEALGAIAALHRSRMSARSAAITGSTGKTTTKDMLGAIMRHVGATVVAEGTHNNEVGVPLTLLRLRPQDEFCVLELAMRAPGEIGYLARIAQPHVGVITNIGQSHVGRLGTREAIAQTKAELLEHLPPDGAAVLNADDFFFSVFAAMAPCPVVAFGLGPEAQVRAEEIANHDLDRVAFRLITSAGAADVAMPVPGRHNVLNALAAAAAALELGATVEDIAAGLATHPGTAMRMQRVAGQGGSTIINDAYNASPDSVAAALRVLEAAPGRRIFVFADMLEMGREAEPAHREVGNLVARGAVHWLIAVGELAALTAARARELGVPADAVDDAPAAVELLAGELGPDDTVLVKGSRGMRLERVVEALADDH